MKLKYLAYHISESFSLLSEHHGKKRQTCILGKRRSGNWSHSYLFLSGGTIHHLTMILKGPKFKTTPQQWRPFGACHPAIINECFKCSPFVVSIGSKQKPVLSCLCCMAARRLCAGFVVKLGKGRGFNLYLFFFF